MGKRGRKRKRYELDMAFLKPVVVITNDPNADKKAESLIHKGLKAFKRIWQ